MNFLFALMLCFAAAPKSQFPKISALQGTVQDHKSEKPEILKKNMILKEKAHIITSKNAKLRIELDPYSSLTIFENSDVMIPIITWGEGDILDFTLNKGKLRYECEKDCVRSIATELSKTVLTNGEYYLDYHPESPYVELTVMHGTQEFSGIENEASIKLQAGQKVVFQGIKENGEVAFDVLLKGRRVARGQLRPVVTLTEEEIKTYEKLEKAILTAKNEGKIKTIKRTEAQICDKPFGELDQCSWTCEGNLKKLKTCDLNKPGISCVRRRCNANGKWEDPTNLTKLSTKCELKPVVASCDY